MPDVTASIVGGSGYVGGELLRLLLFHPAVSVGQVTSQRLTGRSVTKAHPNLRGVTGLKFCDLESLEPCDVLFLCLPHGRSMDCIDDLRQKATRIVDLSGDFRLKSADEYARWYGQPHRRPELLGEFVYGIPELHRAAIRPAALVSSAGCNATASILALYPLFKSNLVEANRAVVDVKVGSSEAGNVATPGSHHPVRAGCVRSFRPTGHRHTAEVLQELGLGGEGSLHFSATALDMVRGVLATCHVELKEELSERDVWQLYRRFYGEEPFVRIVKERDGIYRYPEPKLLAGTNRCDIGFERDPHSRRLVVISAIDNLMKGAAGQAVQAFNIMHGLDERTGLDFPGLHP